MHQVRSYVLEKILLNKTPKLLLQSNDASHQSRDLHLQVSDQDAPTST